MTQELSILIVDDDQDNAASLGELFELEGHRVSVVHSGQAAIDAYIEKNFDLAFMDVMMPGKNGVESFLEIRRLKPAASVFMMSGYSVEELMQQAVAGGALGYLDKPLEPDEVIRLTRNVGKCGMVLTASADRNASAAIKGALTQNGMAYSVIQNTADVNSITASDSVVVIDGDMKLIDEVAVYRSLMNKGHEGPSILIPRHQPVPTASPHVLRDVGVTGILNKPFDPSDLLHRLQQLVA
jgi:two-component system, NtrC family, response regulator HydG